MGREAEQVVFLLPAYRLQCLQTFSRICQRRFYRAKIAPFAFSGDQRFPPFFNAKDFARSGMPATHVFFPESTAVTISSGEEGA
jgi:hypothetical protein